MDQSALFVFSRYIHRSVNRYNNNNNKMINIQNNNNNSFVFFFPQNKIPKITFQANIFLIE